MIDRTYLPIYKAMSKLASVDDGAKRNDGFGFSKNETELGHSFVEKGYEAWSRKMVVIAYNICLRHSEQLQRLGINVDDLPAPPTDPSWVTSSKQPSLLGGGVGQNVTTRVGGVAAPRAGTKPSTPPVPPKPTRPPVKIIWIDKNFIHLKFENLGPNDWAAIRWKVWDIDGWDTKEEYIAGRDHPERNGWCMRVPLSPPAAIQVDQIASEFGFTASKEDQDIILGLVKKARMLEKASGMLEADVEIDELWTGGELRPFQKVAPRYARINPRFILADDMGTGKTIEGIAIVLDHKAYPCLCIVPATARMNWVHEIQKWAPGKKVALLNSKSKADELWKERPHFIVVNYDILTRLIYELQHIPVMSIILDEGHRIKNEDAARTAAVLAITYGLSPEEAGLIVEENGRIRKRRKGEQSNKVEWRHVDKSKAPPLRIAMSGTPVQNRPYECLALLKFIDRLSDVDPAGETHFRNVYCNGGRRGSANEVELHDALRKTCMLRRTRKEVLPELPPDIHTIIPCDLDPAYQHDYWQAENELFEFVAKEEMRRISIDEEYLESIRYLSTEEQEELISNRVADKVDRAIKGEFMVRITHLRQISEKGKIRFAIKWIKDFFDSVDDSEKLIVFCHHKAAQEEIFRAFPGSARITGDQSAKQRDDNVFEFQHNPNCRIIVNSIRAGSEAITLTAAAFVLFLSLDWTPANIDQAYSRALRMGQEADVVNCYYMIIPRSIEERIARILDMKRRIVKAITDGEAMDSDESVINGLWASMAKSARDGNVVVGINSSAGTSEEEEDYDDED